MNQICLYISFSDKHKAAIFIPNVNQSGYALCILPASVPTDEIQAIKDRFDTSGLYGNIKFIHGDCKIVNLNE